MPVAPQLDRPRDFGAFAMEGPEGPGFFRVTRWVVDAMAWRERQGYGVGDEQSIDSQIIEETFKRRRLLSAVMGGCMFDGGSLPWGDEPPFRAPVFVVTHRLAGRSWSEQGKDLVHVRDRRGPAGAVELAKEAA